MNHSLQAPIRSRSSAGFSLVTVLMLVIVLGFLALGAMNSSIVQERMAGNANDRNRAFQAAEAALKDGEAAVDQLTALGTPVNCAQGSGFCYAPAAASAPDSRPVWQIVDLASAKATLDYGSKVAVAPPALPEVAQQPRYVIEQLDALPPEPGIDPADVDSPPTARAYRVTARGVGAQPNTSVVLQSIYVRR
jgi:type IV pilus assembly protein PilX